MERTSTFDSGVAHKEIEDGEHAQAVLDNPLVVRLLKGAEQTLLEHLRGSADITVEQLGDLRRQFQELNAFAVVMRRFAETGAMAAQQLRNEDEARKAYEERHRE